MPNQGPLNSPMLSYPGQVSDLYTTPFPIANGTKARDGEGNEYVFVDYTSTVYSGCPVLLETTGDTTAQSRMLTARLITGTQHKGPIGVAIAGGTSDNGGWVLIYGRVRMQLGMSGVSPSDAANGPTTAQTSTRTLFQIGTSLSTPAALGWVSDPSTAASVLVDGISVAFDVSLGDVSVGQSGGGTAVTSSPSFTGNEITVFLTYPRITGVELGTAS